MSQPTQQAKGPIAWMARNTVAANLLMFVIIVGGALSLFSVKQEIFPEFDLDIVNVRVPYPGASPAEVEQGIVLAIEEAVRGVDGVKEVTSVSAEGFGNVNVEVQLGDDPDKVLQDVKNEVDRIQTFPEDAEDPSVALLSQKQRVISIVLSGDVSRDALYEISEQARADLLARGGVTQVEVEGLPPLEVSVQVDQATAQAQGLSLDMIAQQITLASLELPGGGIDTTSGEVLVRVSDRARTAEQFRGIVLQGTADGAEVRLGDVARVEDGFEDNDQATLFDGHPAVLLTAYRVGSETPNGVSEVVNAFATDLRNELPRAIDITIWDDDSELLADRIDLLVRNAQSGILLVLLVLALFLDLRLAFWVGLGIPISFFGAFALFPQADASINMISLFALIITLGLVVDDAIVVGENVYEKQEKGMPRLEAAIEGAREMAVPVTFAILTTSAAFAPMWFVPGVSGKIFGLIPTVVLAVLFFSLVESFFVLPAHLGHGSHAEGPPEGTIAKVLDVVDRPRRWVTGHLKRFTDTQYEPLVDRVIRARYTTLAGAIGLFIASVGLVVSGLLPFSFLPKTETDIIRVSARLPYGAPIDRTEEVSDILSAALDRAMDEIGADSDDVRGELMLLGQGGQQMGPGAGTRDVGSHLLSYEVDLVGSEMRDFSTGTLTKAWEKQVPPLAGVESVSFVNSLGPSGGAAVDVQLQSSDTEVLAAASEEVTDALRAYSDLMNVNNGYAAGKVQFDIQLLPEGRGLGLTTQAIARQIRASFFGAEAIREQRGRSEVRVMVRLPDEERSSEYDLDQLRIRTPVGAWVPLNTVATATRTQAATNITRDEGERVVNVTAELAEGVASSRPVLEDLEAGLLPDLENRYPGLRVGFAGEQESQNESLAALGQNFFFAMFVIYALLAIPFKSYVQPAIIMSAIPFGFVGAVWGHVFMGYELSVISVMGIIALSGVVVNDSLVLIDAANGYRKAPDTSPHDAIIGAGKRRLRPILLTSLTTFFGLLPMIFETSVQARFLIPMAISLGFGVLFATVIVLLLVPALYMIIEDVIWLFQWLYGSGAAPGTSEAQPAK